MGVYWMNQCAQALRNFDEEKTKVCYLRNIHI